MSSATRANVAFIIAAAAGLVACRAEDQATRPVAQTQPAPVTQAAVATQPALDPTIDKILTRLEGREVRDLKAAVSWKLQYLTDLEEDAVTKVGELWYQQQEPVSKFLVHFTKKITASRQYDLDERHMFDGRWYEVMRSETKTFERREIRREGDVGNPYKLGEGPFPVPFGQKKADILKEFEVSLLPPAPDDPAQTDHLNFVPRSGTQMEETYKQVDVWIAREGPNHDLPIKVHTAKKEAGKLNSFITITFSDIKLNQGFSGSVFHLTPPPGYDVEEERLEPIPPPPDAAQPPKGP
jgi:hypothetical protein